jgi:transposase-like protein
MTRAERAQRRRRMTADLAAGASLEEVARRHGVCPQTVRQAALEAGLRLEDRRRGERFGQLGILSELLTGRSYGEVARRLGVSKQRVAVVAADAARYGLLTYRDRRRSIPGNAGAGSKENQPCSRKKAASGAARSRAARTRRASSG